MVANHLSLRFAWHRGKTGNAIEKDFRCIGE